MVTYLGNCAGERHTATPLDTRFREHDDGCVWQEFVMKCEQLPRYPRLLAGIQVC